MSGRLVSLEEAGFSLARVPGHEPDRAERAFLSRVARRKRQLRRLRPRFVPLLHEYRHMVSLGLAAQWWAFHAPVRYRRGQ